MKSEISEIDKRIKALEAEKVKLYAQARVIDKEIQSLESEKQAICKHEHTKIVRDEYFEQGKMRYPVEFHCVVCSDCGKELKTF